MNVTPHPPQGVDFRGVMYRLSGSKLLGGLQDIARTLQYQLRKTAQLQVGAPGDGGAGAGGGERTQSAVLFAHTVHLQLVVGGGLRCGAYVGLLGCA